MSNTVVEETPATQQEEEQPQQEEQPPEEEPDDAGLPFCRTSFYRILIVIGLIIAIIIFVLMFVVNGTSFSSGQIFIIVLEALQVILMLILVLV